MAMNEMQAAMPRRDSGMLRGAFPDGGITQRTQQAADRQMRLVSTALQIRDRVRRPADKIGPPNGAGGGRPVADHVVFAMEQIEQDQSELSNILEEILSLL